MTALYTRYRSQRFDALVGQEAAVRTLKNALAGDRVAHAYLFTGIRGTGKTTTARLLAKAVNCLSPIDGEPDNTCVNCVAINDSAATDLIEIDAASNRGIDDIRDLREKARYLPALLKRKVYIIDEAHQLSGDAFNALLKTLEEPPAHVLFILCTTEAHKLPATIISRTQRFDFRRISEEEIAGHLAFIAAEEKLEARPDGLRLLAAMAQGSMRDAVTMLDQMDSAGVEAIDASTVRRQLGLVTQLELAQLLADGARGDAGAVLRELDRMAGQGADMRQLTSNLAEMSRKAVLMSIAAGDPAALGIEEAAAPAMQEVVDVGGREFAARAFELAVVAGTEMRQTHDPRLLLELTLLKLATAPATAPPAPAPGTAPLASSTRDSSQVPARAVLPPTAPAASPPATAPPPPASPPAPASPRAEVPPLPPAGAGEVADVRARWPALLDSLRGSAPATRLRALLNDASPLSLQDDLLTIGFRFAMLSEKAQEPLHRAELEKALAQVFGRTFRLAFKVTPELPSAGSALPTEPGPGRAPAVSSPSPQAAEDLGPVADDPGPASEPAAVAGSTGPGEVLSGEKLVEAAVEILGARITDIRPRQRPV